MKFEFSDHMNEISGLGGAHERALRLAVTTGALWLALHPQADPQLEGDAQGCWGDNEDGEHLLRVIKNVVFTGDDGVKVALEHVLTPSMYYAASYHIMWIGEHGWNAYVAAMCLPLHIYGPEAERINHHA